MSLQTHKLTLVIAVGKAGQVWLEYKNAKLASFTNRCIYLQKQKKPMLQKPFSL